LANASAQRLAGAVQLCDFLGGQGLAEEHDLIYPPAEVAQRHGLVAVQGSPIPQLDVAERQTDGNLQELLAGGLTIYFDSAP
jgi:hypothetical protein